MATPTPTLTPSLSFNGLALPPPYHESPLAALALLSATLLGIYATGLLFDRLCYAGLVAQLLAGALLGPPLLDIWPADWLTTFRMLGDVGILLLIFSGGLAVDAHLLRKHLAPAVATALVGGMLPIALAVVFLGACLGFPWMEAFTAGAALSSTSFGTTLVALGQADPARIERRRSQRFQDRVQDMDHVGVEDHDAASETLSTLGPLRTRVGTVLVAAAMLDDVVGLLLLSVITALAQSPEPTNIFTFQTLGKPVLASIAVLTLPPLIAAYLVRPVARWCVPWIVRRASADSVVYGLIAWMMLVLAGLVGLSDVVGTTRILGSFSAGLFVNLVGVPVSPTDHSPTLASCLESVFHGSLGRVNNWVMLPLFFLSMGTPLPITHMFHLSILWQGLVFSMLMFLAKFLTGPVILHVFSSPRTRAAHAAYQSPPAVFLGLGLVARGEVGIIMAQVAHAASLAMTWGDILDTHLYLVSMWAILVCTVVGPIGFAKYTRARWGGIVGHEGWGLAAAEAKAAAAHEVGGNGQVMAERAELCVKEYDGGQVAIHVDVTDGSMLVDDAQSASTSRVTGSSCASSSASLEAHAAPVAIEMNGMPAASK